MFGMMRFGASKSTFMEVDASSLVNDNDLTVIYSLEEMSYAVVSC